MSEYIGDLMYPSEEKYFSNGEEKTRWLNCGGVFKNEQGQISVKITTMPTTMTSNWFRCFPPRDQGDNKFKKSAVDARAPQQPPLPDDDIPF